MNVFRLLKVLFIAVLLLALYGFSLPPSLESQEERVLAQQFRFIRHRLPELPQAQARFGRDVHPSLKHISSWISSVGASVALSDLDGDGYVNDVCYVDTRLNEVVVGPVPRTGARYNAFSLNLSALPYDPVRTAPMGCLPGDFNEDGWTDLLVYFWGRTPIAFLHTTRLEHTSTLAAQVYQAAELVNTEERWFTNAATQADLDGDGHADLVLGNYFADGSRILDASAVGTEQMQHSMSRAFNGGSTRFLLWNGAEKGLVSQISFKDVRPDLPDNVLNGWTLAVAAADLDGDLLPELYLANDFGPDRLLHNRSAPGALHFSVVEGVKTLTTPNSKALGRDSFKGMGVDFGDLNQDGLMDIYVSNIASNFALHESHFAFINTGEQEAMMRGRAPFVDQSEPLGLARSSWAWEARLGDFNNDGVVEAMQATGFVKGSVNRWPELHELAMGNDELLRHPAAWPAITAEADLSGHAHNPFFARSQSGRYYDIAASIGLNETSVSRGIATADVNGDGALDFAVANQWDSSNFYYNISPAINAFLGLRLLLPLEPREKVWIQPGLVKPVQGRAAIGAAVRLELPDGRPALAQVDGGNGHSGRRSTDIHIGLGALRRGQKLQARVIWRDPSGNVHEQNIMVQAGWNTVLLSWPES